MDRSSHERRLLMVVPTTRDAELTGTLLGKAGVECCACRDLSAVTQSLKDGAAAVLLPEELLTPAGIRQLSEALSSQPAWSDVPLLVLTHQGADSPAVTEAAQVLGNVTLLERPIRVATLVSAVRMALRARERQYELRDQLEALRLSEQNLADFFENAAVGLHLLDERGVIQRVNQTELKLLGYTADEYVGHHIGEFHADRSAAEDLLNRLRAGETIDSFEATLRSKSGTLCYVLVSANVLWDEGKFVHARCFTRDITPRKKAEQALREADRRKDEFLATLAHELRNPLAPIRNSLHILQLTGECDPASARVCEMLDRQVNHLVRLVDDLMEVSRITRGKIELKKEPVELAAIIRSAVETSRPFIDAGRHQLAISVPSEMLLVDGDFVRLAQVLTNLLNNAAKYTQDGGQIWLTARCEDDHAVISVRDNGIGIPEDMLPRVFDMFTQVDRSTGRAKGGLGIGLALVRSLVEMHGGEVHVSSEGPGRGSEFTIRLPLASPCVQNRPSRTPFAPTTALPDRRVLVVDDNRDAADSLVMLLRVLGAEVQAVYDGPSALEAIERLHPAVVLLDIGMPGMDGYEVARRIHQRPDLQGILLVALTGWGQEEDRRRSQSAGFNRHLTKPPDIGVLQSLLVSLH